MTLVLALLGFQILPALHPAARLPSPCPPDFEVEVAELYEQFCVELIAYADSIIRNQDLAREAVQEAFLRYFVARTHGRYVEHPRAWLYRVTRNYLLDRLDAAATKNEVDQDHAVDVPDQNHGPEEMLHHSQVARRLVSMLSPRELECLRLRADGLSYEEIGDVLSVRPGTISALLTRVHKKLREAVRNGEDCRQATIEAIFILIGGGTHLYPS